MSRPVFLVYYVYLFCCDVIVPIYVGFGFTTIHVDNNIFTQVVYSDLVIRKHVSYAVEVVVIDQDHFNCEGSRCWISVMF